MKAIIQVTGRGLALRAARVQVEATRSQRSVDYHLSFESVHSLFTELTPDRLELLIALRRVGPCRVHALAQASARGDSNVRADVSRLEELGLIDLGDEGSILVPLHSRATPRGG